MRSEDALDALGRTARDVGDLGASGGRQRVEDERAVFALPDVDAIQRQDMGMHIESQGAITPPAG